MKAKLIKNKYGDDFYYLMVGIDTYATTHKESFRRLSLKNCQAIELGYDLDELAENEVIYMSRGDERLQRWYGFVDGFEKALEILGDKKFSEDDVRKAILLSIKYNDVGVIQSLQQTEFDVEIVMEDSIALDGHTIIGIEPKLDEDGCLILSTI